MLPQLVEIARRITTGIGRPESLDPERTIEGIPIELHLFADALVTIGIDSATVGALTRDPDGATRHFGMLLSRMLPHPPPEALPPIIAALTEGDRWRRVSAFRALRRFGVGAEPAVASLLAALRDEETRTDAVMVFEMGPHARPAVEWSARQREESVSPMRRAGFIDSEDCHVRLPVKCAGFGFRFGIRGGIRFNGKAPAP